MIKKHFNKIIALGIVATSVLAINPIGASAEWKQDSNGWWNTEGSSYSTGWKLIDGKWYYFDSSGYMKTGWIQDGGKWYYLYGSGAMAKNTVINGYELAYDGAWIQSAQKECEKVTINDNSNFNIDQFISTMKTKVDNVEVKDEKPFSDFLPDATRKIVDIDGEYLNVYIYSSNQEMEKAASSIYSNGYEYTCTSANAGTTSAGNGWNKFGHFYKKGNIIVQYGGTKENIFYDLNDIFGEQFIGYTKNISIKKVNSKYKKISDVTGINLDDITKIVFGDGRGYKQITVEDEQKVKEFIKYLDGYVITEGKNPESTGWIHSADFYINETDVMSVTFVDPLIINGNYYNIIQGGLDAKKIDDFLKSIDNSYDIMAGL
ncbi:hypothetical protein [Clostridium saccharobutylicum]|uniref:Autolysin n=1 Tax=Clostridium saccharobutylicum TaxID=169679 RepID=A0A1S8N1S7_CLOSA|nr:hypothetical protein [Clostridium saccharobutylicum]OOM10414.1 autolysin [Clostridium saccharobutylicum]